MTTTLHCMLPGLAKIIYSRTHPQLGYWGVLPDQRGVSVAYPWTGCRQSSS